MSSGVVTSKILDLTGFSYSKPAYQYCTEELIENAETQLYGHNVDFDSMVGIGLSGILVLPLLARHFNVPFFACRRVKKPITTVNCLKVVAESVNAGFLSMMLR